MQVKNIILSALFLLVSTAHAFCFNEASSYYQVNAEILKAIAIHESGGNSQTVAHNKNGSLDIGLMGINTVNVKQGSILNQAGIQVKNLLDPCMNVMVGAYLLRQKIDKYGMSWLAIGAYHSETPSFNLRYQWMIFNVLNNRSKQASNVVALNN